MSDQRDPYATPDAEITAPAETILASRWLRLGAAIFDMIIILIPVGALMYFNYADKIMTNAMELADNAVIAVASAACYLLFNGYLLARSGQTIGKYLVEIRIVDYRSGEILPLWKLFTLRYLVIAVVSNIPVAGPFLAIINILFIFGPERRCVHDYIAGTHVIMAR